MQCHTTQTVTDVSYEIIKTKSLSDYQYPNNLRLAHYYILYNSVLQQQRTARSSWVSTECWTVKFLYIYVSSHLCDLFIESNADFLIHLVIQHIFGDGYSLKYRKFCSGSFLIVLSINKHDKVDRKVILRFCCLCTVRYLINDDFFP